MKMTKQMILTELDEIKNQIPSWKVKFVERAVDDGLVDEFNNDGDAAIASDMHFIELKRKGLDVNLKNYLKVYINESVRRTQRLYEKKSNAKMRMKKTDEAAKLFFQFTFSNEDTGRCSVKRIEVLPPKGITLEECYEIGTSSDDFQREIDSQDLERTFGVHDGEGGEEDKDRWFGYSSYEVAKENYQELMDVWKDILIKLGFTIVKCHKC